MTLTLPSYLTLDRSAAGAAAGWAVLLEPQPVSATATMPAAATALKSAFIIGPFLGTRRAFAGLVLQLLVVAAGGQRVITQDLEVCADAFECRREQDRGNQGPGLGGNARQVEV